MEGTDRLTDMAPSGALGMTRWGCTWGWVMLETGPALHRSRFRIEQHLPRESTLHAKMPGCTGRCVLGLSSASLDADGDRGLSVPSGGAGHLIRETEEPRAHVSVPHGKKSNHHDLD